MTHPSSVVICCCLSDVGIKALVTVVHKFLRIKNKIKMKYNFKKHVINEIEYNIVIILQGDYL